MNMNPVPPVREVSPVSPAPPASVNQKGPDVYYPPGAEFTKSVQVDYYCHINWEDTYEKFLNGAYPTSDLKGKFQNF